MADGRLQDTARLSAREHSFLAPSSKNVERSASSLQWVRILALATYRLSVGAG
jgi:hypothetical protein